MKKLTLLLLPLLCQSAIAAEPLKDALEIRVDAQQEATSTQQEIDQLVDQSRDMVQEYEQATTQLADLRIYNDQLAKLVDKQQSELDSFDKELQNALDTNRSIVPMMLKMLTVLQRFIELDTPFLAQERQLRLSALKDMMDKPETTLTEKFRRILEAYQIEADYGRTIEAYDGDVTLGDETLSVEFLRLGRVALYFTTLDGSRAGYWDRTSKSWEDLSSRYDDAIDLGLRIARKQAPPELLQLPLAHSPIRTGGAQ